MNVPALISVVALGLALIAIFGALILSASRAAQRGELDRDGLKILKWGLVGHVVLYVLLAITAFLTVG